MTLFVKQFVDFKITLFTSVLLLLIATYASVVNANQGKTLYHEFCATCHGKKLQGGSAKSIADNIWQFGSDRKDIIRNVKEGLIDRGMPGFKEVLTDEQIIDILDYLKNPGVVIAQPAKEFSTVKTLDYNIKVEVWADGLEVPWGICFLDEETALVTERPGRLRMIQNGKLNPDPIKGIPRVLNEGQGGLLDVAVDPDYKKNGWVYLAYSHALPAKGNKKPVAMTRIVRGRIRSSRWVDQQVLYQAPHESYLSTRHHYGCRIVFDKKGYLYFAIGERGHQDHAQDISKPNGKIHRIYPDGTVPKDNPFVGTEDALPTIYTYGNRNPQGLSMHPVTDDLWQVEHGPMGGDELNLMIKGANYGWPVITYGLNYNGTIVSELTEKTSMLQPILYWTPSIAVCSMDFYVGDMFKKWQNRLLVTALKFEELRLLDIKEKRVLHQEIILKDFGRVRDVMAGPDGAIYVLINQPGRVLRLTPQR